MDEKIIPTCRYGHGNLERQHMDQEENQLFKVDPFPIRIIDLENPADHYVFSFSIYKCPKCTYMELHDDV